MSDREVLAERLAEAGLSTERFVDVKDGQKESVDHTQRPASALSGNYGVYAGGGLVDVDVDDYSDDAESQGLEAVNSLPETLTTESPHTDGENGGHRYYRVTTDRDVDDYDVDAILTRYIKDDGPAKTYHAAMDDPVALGIAECFGKVNMAPSWGELRVCNQYVVGPGSELDGCDKEWHDCSEPGEGHYRIANDAPIAEIELDRLLDVLRASGCEETGGESVSDTSGSAKGYDEALEVALNDNKIVTYLTEGAGVEFDGDRSDADFYVACRMVENHVPREQAEQLLIEGLGEDNTPNTKVRERGGWYGRTWENARQKVREEQRAGGGSESDDYAPIQVEDGRTFFVDDDEWEEVLNFELDVDSILRVDGREVIEADLTRPNGQTDTVQFEPRHLQKKQRFKDNVLDGKFGLTFKAPGRMAETVLNALNEHIGTLDVPVRHGTHHMGLHGGEWVTPGGSLGAEGWVDEPEHSYVERNVALERALSLPTDTAEFDDADVRQILTSLPDTRDTARMLAVLGWFYSAPLRPYIFDEWGAGAFNHLSITGDTGSGKTTTLRYLWRCFGVESDPFAVTDTKFAMLSALAASNGLPVWYDEYKPSEIQDYRLDQFHDLYRKAATGGTATRGRADQTTEEYHTHAPIVVSGEEQIRRPAERRRSIMVAFREDVTAKGTDTRTAFKELVGEGRVEDGELVLPNHAPDPSNHALAYYRWIAGQDTTDLRAKWQDARELVWEKRREWEADYDLDDMEVQGLQTVAFGWMAMRAFARDHGVALTNLPDGADLDDALQHIAGEIGPDGQRKSHMDRFVELFERAAAAEYVESGQHYKVVHEEKPGEEEMRIHLGRAYDALSRYVRDHGLDNEELLSNADDYRKRFKESVESGDTYASAYSQPTEGLGRCVGINTVATMTALDFDRRTFDLPPMGSSESRSGASNTDENPQQATATDGGDGTPVPDDAEGATADVRRLAKWVKDSKSTLPKGRVVQLATERLEDTDPGRAEDLLDKACREGLIEETGDGYRA